MSFPTGHPFKLSNPDPTKLRAVQRALEMGYTNPKHAVNWIKTTMGIDMKPNVFGYYRKHLAGEVRSNQPHETETPEPETQRPEKTPQRLKGQREWVRTKRAVQAATQEEIGVSDLVRLAGFAKNRGGIEAIDLAVARFAEDFGGVAKMEAAIKAITALRSSLLPAPATPRPEPVPTTEPAAGEDTLVPPVEMMTERERELFQLAGKDSESPPDEAD